jgi:SAM-dependent methyltransferase
MGPVVTSSEDYSFGGTGRETLERFGETPRFNRWMYDTVQPYLGQCVLEIGCGIGSLTELLLNGSRQVIASDVSAAYVDAVAKRFRHRPGLATMQLDAQDWELASRLLAYPIDTIVCMSVLEHLRDDRAALEAMRDILLPRQGKLLLYVPALSGLYGTLDEHLLHFRRYNRAPLFGLLDQTGFSIEKMRWLNLAGIVGWWMNGRLLHRAILPRAQLQAYDRLVPVFRMLEALTGPFIGQNLFAVARARE